MTSTCIKVTGRKQSPFEDATLQENRDTSHKHLHYYYNLACYYRLDNSSLRTTGAVALLALSR